MRKAVVLGFNPIVESQEKPTLSTMNVMRKQTGWRNVKDSEGIGHQGLKENIVVADQHVIGLSHGAGGSLMTDTPEGEKCKVVGEVSVKVEDMEGDKEVIFINVLCKLSW